jgi:hypothetical protein
MRGVSSRAGALFLLCVLGFACGPALAQHRDLTVDAQPFSIDRADPHRSQFGKLTWRGGLVLRAGDSLFGGYSGLAVSADGSRLLAVSDRGSWLSLTLVHEDGMLRDVAEAAIAPLKLRRQWDVEGGEGLLSDAEGLAPLEWGVLEGEHLISFEHVHRLQRYEFSDGGFSEPKGEVKLPEDARALSANKGLEGVAVLAAGPHAGAIITFAERAIDRDADMPGWMFIGEDTHSIRLKRQDDFDLTGLAALPDGGLIVLERKYLGPLVGVFMRLRHVPAEDIVPGARLVGEHLYESRQGDFIDNMEGVAASRTEDGDIILSVISDDNFNPLQRTLLMQFALPR